MLKYFYGQEIGNNQSGFRAFKRELFNPFVASSTELLLKAMEEKRKIIDVPIVLKTRAYCSSYVKFFKISLSIVLCVILYGLKLLESF